MPSIGYPLWLLAPLLAVAVMMVGRQHVELPGAWHRAIQNELKAFHARSVRQIRKTGHTIALFGLWGLLSAALATISLGQIDIPQLRNLEARVVVIDLGMPAIAGDRIAAARYLIDSAEDVPTAVVAVTEHAFDVVPLTRDGTHLDRYLQVLTSDVMPIEGRSLMLGIERAVALLDRAGIQARQITVFTGGEPPPVGRFIKPEQDVDQGLWLILPDQADAAWQDLAGRLEARLATDREAPAIHLDFEERRQEAAAKAISVRERQDMTPWLIALSMLLWLWLFFRRRPT
ncbi:MAG: hypothetical protein AAF543_00575 [Pseudomonadota bacterium]